MSTVNLDCKLDLKAIALQARNAEYNPKVCKFPLFSSYLNLLLLHYQEYGQNTFNVLDFQFLSDVGDKYLYTPPLLISIVITDKLFFFKVKSNLK